MSEEFKIIVPDEVQKEMLADPELAEAMKSIFAAMHQAHHAVETGKYASMDDAMEAITGNRPRKISELDDIEEEIREALKGE